MNNLGKWSVLDIETTGIDAGYDDIIDIGFLEFDGIELKRKYSSLVFTEKKISKFIEKLTGINQKQVKKAPQWDKVELELQSLEGQVLVAHNAKFEKSFLQKSFDKLGDDRELETFSDSLHFLSLVFPQRSSLGLEGILIDLGIAEYEVHRGFEDSLDLLKVLLFTSLLVKKDKELEIFLSHQTNQFPDEQLWCKNIINLDAESLYYLASQIDFDLDATYENYQNKLKEKSEEFKTTDKFNDDFSGKRIQNLFRGVDAIKEKIKKYSYRPSQESLALRLGQAFANKIHALVQAPTGTGKTLGYLLPSIIFSKYRHEPVLISTGTKALQEQAMQKDIPDALKILNLNKEDIKIVRLMGSKNHLCELFFRKQDNKEQESLALFDQFEQKFSQAYFEMLFFYNSRVSDYQKAITLNSLPYVLKKSLPYFSDLTKEITVEYKACIGGKCPFKDSCTYFQGLQLAKEADLIIGNHSLMMTWPKGIEKPKYIVVDEAHKIEQEATQSFTTELSKKELESLSKNLNSMIAPLYYLLQLEEKDSAIENIKAEVPRLMGLISDNYTSLAELIERYAKRSPRYTDIYWNEYPMLNKDFISDSLEQSIFNHLESLQYILSEVFDFIKPYIGRWSNTDHQEDNFKVALSLFESFAVHLEEAHQVIAKLFEKNEEMANSIKFHEEHGFIFSNSPVNPGKLFFDQVLEEAESVVFTSATLANESGTNGMEQIEWMTGYNLLPTDKRFQKGLFLNNSFNYKDNAKVYLCSDLPQIYSNDYVETVLKQINKLIESIGGKSLLLFSSRQRFDIACELILSRFDGELEIFIQGLGKNIVEDFKACEHGVLIGMESFGEGIDIPGKSLEFVYVDKIPDIRQDFVITKRREFFQKTFGNEFSNYFMATRARLLHQKLGRLLRTENDRGCIIITDPRTAKWKSRTINEFKNMMNPYDIQFDKLDSAVEKAQDFLN